MVQDLLMERLTRICWVDLRALALLRMALGGLILADLWVRVQDFSAFYTSSGVLPASFLIRSQVASQYLDLYRHCDTPLRAGGLFFFQAGVALALIAGYRTRLSTVISWYLLASLHRRNVLLLDAGDLELKLVLFWSIFLPMGARWSWDARRHSNEVANICASAASAAYLLQIGFIYFFAAAMKSDPVWRVNGDALFYALSIDQYSTGLAQFLMNYPSFLRPPTFMALALEFSVLFAFCSPWRNAHCRLVILIALALYHLSMAALFHFGLFQPICLAMLLGLLPLWLRDPPETVAVSERGRLPRPLSALILASLVLIFWQNAGYLRVGAFPERLGNVLRRFALHQHWDIFTPHPLVQDGWFIIEATRADGAVVDLLRSGQPLSWEKPDSVAAQFPNERWRRYYQTLWSRTVPIYLSRYLWWERERWNLYHTGNDRIVSLRFVFVEEYTNPPGQAPSLRTVILRTFPDQTDSEAMVAPETMK